MTTDPREVNPIKYLRLRITASTNHSYVHQFIKCVTWLDSKCHFAQVHIQVVIYLAQKKNSFYILFIGFVSLFNVKLFQR
jgi:hypothetical protein